MNLKTLIKKYQEAFNNQDIDKLSELFSDDIFLKDWDRCVTGKNNALMENKKIFTSVESIKVKTLNEYFFENTAICVLKIHINSNEIIDVVDIIEVDKDKKISSIIAYKG